MAFNLAIKVYRLNVTLPVTSLLNQGNKLRWTSLKMKDLIAEGFSGRKESEEIIRILKIVSNLNQEVISLLKKIRTTNNHENKQITDLINNYKKLGQKADEYLHSLQSEKIEYQISFPDSMLMDMAG